MATAWGAALLLGGVLASASAPSRETIKLETAPALTEATLEKAQLFTMEAAAWKDPLEAPRPGPQPIPLVVDFATNRVEVGTEGKLQTVRLRSYNGGLVGPTFRVKPGDTLKIDLYNRLPKPPAAAHAKMEQCGIHEHNDVTNLHTHGLHISPSGESDNVLREIEPGGPGAPASHFVFKILPDGNPTGWPAVGHFPGTHWYHAHLHGGTAVQLASDPHRALHRQVRAPLPHPHPRGPGDDAARGGQEVAEEPRRDTALDGNRGLTAVAVMAAGERGQSEVVAVPPRRSRNPKGEPMIKPAKKVRLSRETLRSLDEGGYRPEGPVGTEPDSDIPNNTCFTLSCRHC